MLGEVIIGEFAPLLFASPFGLIPLPFQNIFIITSRSRWTDHWELVISHEKKYIQ